MIGNLWSASRAIVAAFGLLVLLAGTPVAMAQCVRLSNGVVDCSGRGGGRAPPPRVPSWLAPPSNAGLDSRWVWRQWGFTPPPPRQNPPSTPSPPRQRSPPPPPPKQPAQGSPQPAGCISSDTDNVGAMVGGAACAEVLRRCSGGAPAPRVRTVCSEFDRDVCLDKAPQVALESQQGQCLQLLLSGGRFCSPAQSQRLFRNVVEFSCGEICPQCDALAQAEGGTWA